MSPRLRRVRAQFFQNFSRKAILKLQDQLSRHDRCKILDQRHLKYVRRSKSINQRMATVEKTCARQGWGFELTTVAIRWLVDLDPPIEGSRGIIVGQRNRQKKGLAQGTIFRDRNIWTCLWKTQSWQLQKCKKYYLIGARGLRLPVWLLHYFQLVTNRPP